MNNLSSKFDQDLTKPNAIIANCISLNPSDEQYIDHPIIQRFGSPSQPIYVDQCRIDINGVNYDNPLILPIYDGQLELVQCAVLQDVQRVQVIPDKLAKGFAMFGELHLDKPVIITYRLEAFFKIAQTGYSVAMVVLPTLCNAKQTALKAFDFEQIQFVIHQLSKAGYTKLYLPAGPVQMQSEAFQNLEKNTTVRLLNQLQIVGDKEFFTELFGVIKP